MQGMPDRGASLIEKSTRFFLLLTKIIPSDPRVDVDDCFASTIDETGNKGIFGYLRCLFGRLERRGSLKVVGLVCVLHFKVQKSTCSYGYECFEMIHLLDTFSFHEARLSKGVASPFCGCHENFRYRSSLIACHSIWSICSTRELPRGIIEDILHLPIFITTHAVYLQHQLQVQYSNTVVVALSDS